VALDCTINHDEKLITIIGSGIVTLDERYNCVRNLLRNDFLGRTYHALFEVSSITNNLLAHELQPTATLLAMLQDKIQGRVAIVNTHAGHATTASLVAISADADCRFVRAFLSVDEARDWLFAPPPNQPYFLENDPA